MIRSGIAIFVLVLLTAACAPVLTDFYRPAAPDGRVARTHCPPAQRIILFERHDVTIGITIGMFSKGHVEGMVTYEIPEGKVVYLLDQEVEVSVPSRGTTKAKLTSGLVWSGGLFSQPHDASPANPLIGKTTMRLLFSTPTRYGKTNHASYTFRFSGSLDRPEVPESLAIKLPRFSVNDTEVDLPPITFILDREFAIIGLNC
jgi:hypothetical protein